MPTQPLPFWPAGDRSLAFRKLCAWLKNHPHLASGRVKTWRAWEGLGTIEAADPEIAECPWVRLTPITAPASRAHLPISNQGQVFDSPLVIKIETAVEGSRFDNSDQLWTALESVLFPPPGSDVEELRELLKSAGIREILLRSPALPTGFGDYSEAMIAAEGTIELSMFIQPRRSGD